MKLKRIKLTFLPQLWICNPNLTWFKIHTITLVTIQVSITTIHPITLASIQVTTNNLEIHTDNHSPFKRKHLDSLTMRLHLDTSNNKLEIQIINKLAILMPLQIPFNKLEILIITSNSNNKMTFSMILPQTTHLRNKVPLTSTIRS